MVAIFICVVSRYSSDLLKILEIMYSSQFVKLDVFPVG